MRATAQTASAAARTGDTDFLVRSCKLSVLDFPHATLARRMLHFRLSRRDYKDGTAVLATEEKPFTAHRN